MKDRLAIMVPHTTPRNSQPYPASINTTRRCTMIQYDIAIPSQTHTNTHIWYSGGQYSQQKMITIVNLLMFFKNRYKNNSKKKKRKEKLQLHTMSIPYQDSIPFDARLGPIYLNSSSLQNSDFDFDSDLESALLILILVRIFFMTC